MADSTMVSAEDWPSFTCLSTGTDFLDTDLDNMEFDVDFLEAHEKAGHSQSYDAESEGPPWDCLPLELLIKIFSYLRDKDKENAECTCVAWHEACKNPTLWHTQVYSFTGDNCLELVHQACRTLRRKGYLMRTMTLKIGMPSLPQAWVMSQCVQQLLEFITNQPGTRYINKLTITSLNFFKHWRFFTLSKWNILLAVSNFLLSQRHLQEVNLSQCRLCADDGMRLLRALVVGPARQTVRHLSLHDFFQTKYQATLGGRFSRLLTSSFTTLHHLAVDARHVDSNFLLGILTKSPSKESLHHLSLAFGSIPPRELIAESVWERVSQLSPDLRVSFLFEDKMNIKMAKGILTPSVPLTSVVVSWPRGSRKNYSIHLQLRDFLQRLVDLYWGVLERFRLHSNIRASADVERALILLAKNCRRLNEFGVTVRLRECVLNDIRSILLRRSQHTIIEVNPLKRKKSRVNCHKTRNRTIGIL